MNMWEQLQKEAQDTGRLMSTIRPEIDDHTIMLYHLKQLNRLLGKYLSKKDVYKDLFEKIQQIDNRLLFQLGSLQREYKGKEQDFDREFID